jgi:hypothetical protein
MDEDTSNDPMLMMYAVRQYVGMCKTCQLCIRENTLDLAQILIC